jgi:hypothetical protein
MAGSLRGPTVLLLYSTSASSSTIVVLMCSCCGRWWTLLVCGYGLLLVVVTEICDRLGAWICNCDNLRRLQINTTSTSTN